MDTSIRWKLHGNVLMRDLQKPFDNWYRPNQTQHQIAIIIDDKYRQLLLASPELLASLREILPLAEAFLKSAPSHPDNAKLEDARALIVRAESEAW